MIKQELYSAIAGISSKGITRRLKCKFPKIYQTVNDYAVNNKISNINEAIYRILNDILTTPICKKCRSRELKFLNYDHGYQKLCGRCSMPQKLKETMLEKHGVENISKLVQTQEKKKKTCLEKYGVESPNQLDSVKEKKKQTIQKNYGNKGLAHERIYAKRLTTCQKKYGVDHHTKLKSVQEKKKKTCLEKYGVENVMHNKNIKQKMRSSLFDKEKFVQYIKSICESRNQSLISDYNTSHDNVIIKCHKCSNTFSILWNSYQQGGGVCPHCYPLKHGISKSEKDIAEYIRSDLGIDLIENSKDIISPYELDIVIPSHSIAIEYCGLWCHSSGGKDTAYRKDKDYHVNKLNLCNKKGYRLITIFEDEWLLKQETVKSCLEQRFNSCKYRIYGRECQIKTLQSTTKKKFFSEYHLQGDTISRRNYGLYYNNILVSAMSFKLIDSINKVWNLERYCCKNNTFVIGGPSKILSHFKKHNEWNKIVTYADKRWSNGNVYEKIGFSYVHDTEPNYWYWGKNIIGRKHRLNFHKSKLTEFEHYHPNLSEKDIMSLEGYNWIYDCGNIRFEMLKNKV